MKNKTMIRAIQPRGYTLAELMVAVAIIGILAGFSIVVFATNWQQERLKAAGREATTWLEQVRRIAIQKSKPCRVTIDQANATFALQPDLANPQRYCANTDYAPLQLRAAVPNSSELLVCTQDLPSEQATVDALSCTGNPMSTSSFLFTPRGTTTNAVLIQFHLPEAGPDRCIAVMAPLGQIRSGKQKSSICDFTTAF